MLSMTSCVESPAQVLFDELLDDEVDPADVLLLEVLCDDPVFDELGLPGLVVDDEHAMAQPMAPTDRSDTDKEIGCLNMSVSLSASGRTPIDAVTPRLRRGERWGNRVIDPQ
jgi:hypothetical protein